MQTRLVYLLFQVPVITNYLRRKRWQDQFGDDVTIVPIYNTGQHLLRGTLCCDAVTYYDPKEPWQWILYREFQEAKYILANKRLLGEKAIKPDMIGIQHLGHDRFGVARILTMSSPSNSLPYHVQIRPQEIMFLAVRKGIIVSRLHTYQHLPREIRSQDHLLTWIHRYTFNEKQIKQMKHC